MKCQECLPAAGALQKPFCSSRKRRGGRLPARSRIIIATMVSVAFVSGTLETWAFRSPERAPLPDFDQRTAAAAGVADLAQQQAVDQLKTRVPTLQFSRDRLLGTPRLVSASSGFLSAPNSGGASGAGATSLIGAVNDPYRPIKDFLNGNSTLFGHRAEVLTSARVKRDYVTSHNELRTVIWEQVVDDIAVFDGLLVGHITRNGELVSISSRFLPAASQAADAGTPNRTALVASPSISAAEAVARAAANIGDEL